MYDKLHWLGHDSFRIDADVTIYIDPWKLAKDSPPADLILITHEHHDHFSKEDIEQIRRRDTQVITTPTVAQGLNGSVREVQPGDQVELGAVIIDVLPAYNIEKRFHPRSAGHVGYVITIDGLRIYHAGDTDAIPEMVGLAPDIVLLPVSGTYVMNPDEALEAIRLLEPKLVVPMHYGDIVGTLADAERLRSMSDVPVVILPAER
ncbi:MAG: MBL fold metallo-hydrolase [Anaerolineae bacterium]|nr:MBL fold metallo-hydrolase [Anaerolineae bacterium]